MRTVFETIKDRLPITEVLSSYITVLQSGSTFKAKCPFHNERTASFSISPERGLYYCFGCGAKGDIFNFVEQFEGLDRKGALKLLADRAGVALTNATVPYSDTDPLYEILEKATLLYQETLKNTASALAYLEKRGLVKETIDAFRIGYAPDEWRSIDSLCSSDKERDAALRAGLTKKTEDLSATPTHAGQAGKVYDRFRKRIMFPLTDGSGRVIGFSGRSFPATTSADADVRPAHSLNVRREDYNVPKYLNSPETELFQKSKTLFGFDKAKLHIKKHNFAILVEGQMDLVISHQAGFKNTVASSGTAVSEDAVKDPFSNLSVLSRLTPHIFLAFDGDPAGQKAMDRAALVALSLGMNPKVVVLPEEVDPADYIKNEGSDAWKERLKTSKHFIDHHLSLIRAQSHSPHVFVKTIKEKLFPFLARVASPMERNLYITKIAQEIGMSPTIIAEELLKVSVVSTDTKDTSTVPSRRDDTTLYERLTALRKRFNSPAIEAVAEKLNTLSVGDIIFSATPVEEDRLERALNVVEEEYGSLDTTVLVEVSKELVEKITQEFLRGVRSIYSKQLKQAEENHADGEVDRLSALLGEISKRQHESPTQGG